MRTIRDPRIIVAMRLLERPFDQRPTTAGLARAVGLSRFHFMRLFCEQVGETVGEYAGRIRLDNAALRLRWTREPILSIAVDTGYGSQAAFTRAFAARTGLSPARYRAGDPAATATGAGPEASGGEAVAVRWSDALLCLGLRTIGVRDRPADFWGALVERLPAGLRSGVPLTFLDILHDNPRVTAPAQIRRDACIVLPAAFDPSGLPRAGHGLHLTATAPAWYAAAHQRGGLPEAPYDLILDQWLPAQSRHRLCGSIAALELYAPPSDPRAAERAAREVLVGLRSPGETQA